MFKKIWSKEILTRILIPENDDANLASKKHTNTTTYCLTFFLQFIPSWRVNIHKGSYSIVLCFNIYFFNRFYYWELRFGDADKQIESSTIQIWNSTNSDNNYDTNPIPTTILSRRLQFWSNFDLFLIKVDHFQSLFDWKINMSQLKHRKS